MSEVSIVRCDNYENENVAAALSAALTDVGGLDFVKPGMTVAIKTNLVAPMKPDKAAVTHPAVVAELVRLLYDRGVGKVIVGDSPGGLFTPSALSSSFRTCGYEQVRRAGAELNTDTSQRTAEYSGKVVRSFEYTSWLDKADAVIDVCKLKTHGMMGMSGGAKNLFGVVPGLTKTEMHFRYSDHSDFANMILDLDDYVSPVLTVCDGVVGMEGNGPTAGTPRHIGCIMASLSPHKLDLAMARVIGLTKEYVPTLEAAYDRGYIPATADELDISGDMHDLMIGDYNNVATKEHRSFSPKNQKGMKKVLWTLAGALLVPRPGVNADECVGCGKCAEMCPADAVEIKEKKAKIKKSDCIKCFCCQEFCPMSAIKVKKTVVSKLLGR